LETSALSLEGLLLVHPKVFRDDRGWFFECYNRPNYQLVGIADTFVQDNHSRSDKGTLRGLHYQSTPGQAKLVRVAAGRILDVAVDIRPSSATFGKWTSVELSAENHHQLYIPIGFAHGFFVLSDEAEVLYKVSAVYDADHECTLAWDDPDIAVAWPNANPNLSARDQRGESFARYRQRVGL